MWVQQLTRLLKLQLEWCMVLPAVLGSLTGLQKLQLQYCRLLPHVQAQDVDTEATAALLDALSKLTCLQAAPRAVQG